MKLTRASSYAIHALVFMAGQKQNRPVPSHLVARARGIPERFLLKVLKPLVSARILYSVKGPNGGYRPPPPAGHNSLRPPRHHGERAPTARLPRHHHRRAT